MDFRHQSRRPCGKAFPAFALLAAVAVLGANPSEGARAPANGNLLDVAERTARQPDHPDTGGGGGVIDRTRLGIDKDRFTLNGRPTFLLGISYYGGLGAELETLRKDLDAMKSHGFNWIRLWATWPYAGEDVSGYSSEPVTLSGTEFDGDSLVGGVRVVAAAVPSRRARQPAAPGVRNNSLSRRPC